MVKLFKKNKNVFNQWNQLENISKTFWNNQMSRRKEIQERQEQESSVLIDLKKKISIKNEDYQQTKINRMYLYGLPNIIYSAFVRYLSNKTHGYTKL